MKLSLSYQYYMRSFRSSYQEFDFPVSLLSQVLRIWWQQPKNAPYRICNLKDDVTSWRKDMFVDTGLWETLQPHVDFEIIQEKDLQPGEVDETIQGSEGVGGKSRQ